MTIMPHDSVRVVPTANHESGMPWYARPEKTQNRAGRTVLIAFDAQTIRLTITTA